MLLSELEWKSRPDDYEYYWDCVHLPLSDGRGLYIERMVHNKSFHYFIPYVGTEADFNTNWGNSWKSEDAKAVDDEITAQALLFHYLGGNHEAV